MRYTSCHDEMHQLTDDVENIIYRKTMIAKYSNMTQKFSVVPTEGNKLPSAECTSTKGCNLLINLLLQETQYFYMLLVL